MDEYYLESEEQENVHTKPDILQERQDLCAGENNEIVCLENVDLALEFEDKDDHENRNTQGAEEGNSNRSEKQFETEKVVAGTSSVDEQSDGDARGHGETEVVGETNNAIILGSDIFDQWIDSCLESMPEHEKRAFNLLKYCLEKPACLERTREFFLRDICACLARENVWVDHTQNAQEIFSHLENEDVNELIGKIGIIFFKRYLKPQLSTLPNNGSIPDSRKLHEIPVIPIFPSHATVGSSSESNEGSAIGSHSDANAQIESPGTSDELQLSTNMSSNQLMCSSNTGGSIPESSSNLAFSTPCGVAEKMDIIPDMEEVADSGSHAPVERISDDVKAKLKLLDENVGSQLIKDVRTRMTRWNITRSAQIVAAGKFLFRKLFSDEEILTGNASGKSSELNKYSVKYDPLKTNLISELIAWFLETASTELTKESLEKYLMKSENIGLVEDDYKSFYQTVLVNYANSIRTKKKDMINHAP